MPFRHNDGNINSKRIEKGIPPTSGIPKCLLLYSRYGLFLFKQCLELFSGNLLFLQKQGCRCVQDVAVVQDDGFGLVITLVYMWNRLQF